MSAKKPTSLKLVEGNRGKRALNKQEPDPEYLEDLAAPAWLSPAAKVVWDELAPRLRKQRLLTVVDVEMLAHGCIAIAVCREAHRELAPDLLGPAKDIAAPSPPVTGAPPAATKINPWRAMSLQCAAFKQMSQVLTAFGCSPAARSRIALQPQGDLFGDAAAESNGYFG